MRELSLTTEQQLRYDVVKILINQGSNHQGLLKDAELVTDFIMAGSAKPTAKFKEAVKQVINESLSSQDDLEHSLEKWLAQRLPVGLLQR